MISINHLDFWYTRRERLFENLSLDLEPGHIYGLLGKNGTGKTTLLKIMSGLSFPKGGEVTMDIWIPSRRNPGFLQEIFFLPEEICLPWVRPDSLVRLFAPFYPGFDATQFERALEMLEVNPEKRLNRLSFGQKKKALIAFALACNTRFLFLDEPTNGLDIPSKAAFRSLLASAFSEERTIILSTHQVRDLQSLIDHVIILSGRTIPFNHSIDHIAKGLSFQRTPIHHEADRVLYSWKTEMGHACILPNDSGEPGLVDIETFFNGALEVPGKITECLKLQTLDV